MKVKIVNFLERFFLFCSSYSPLFIIFIIKYWYSIKISIYPNFGYEIISIFGCIVLCFSIFILIFSTIILYIKLNSYSQSSKKIVIKKVENKTDDLLTYSLPYILTILSMSLIDNDFISLFILFVFIFSIYNKSDMILLNPILSLWGYRFYHVYSDKDYFVVLTKKTNLRRYVDNTINIKMIDDWLYLMEEFNE